MTKVEVLRGIYLFKDLDEEDLEAFAALAHEVQFAPGEVIFAEGESGLTFYAIRQGTVRISKRDREGEEVELANLGSGSYLGEMALVGDHTRSATARAVEPCHLLEIKEFDLEDLLEEKPELGCRFYRTLCGGLARRLRGTSADVGALKRMLRQRG